MDDTKISNFSQFFFCILTILNHNVLKVLKCKTCENMVMQYIPCTKYNSIYNSVQYVPNTTVLSWYVVIPCYVLAESSYTRTRCFFPKQTLRAQGKKILNNVDEFPFLATLDLVHRVAGRGLNHCCGAHLFKFDKEAFISSPAYSTLHDVGGTGGWIRCGTGCWRWEMKCTARAHNPACSCFSFCCCSPWMQMAHFMMIFTYWRSVCCVCVHLFECPLRRLWNITEHLFPADLEAGVTLLVVHFWTKQTASVGPSLPKELEHTHVCMHTYIHVHSCILMLAVFSLTMFAELEIALIIYKVNFLAALGPAQFKHECVWQEIPRAVRWMSCMEREMSVCEFSWRLHRLCCIDCTAALGNEIPM